MGIKRGVSLYSYQQEQFFGQMDWKAQIKEVREGLQTDGIEIIDEQLIRDYPFPSEAFIYDFRNTMARYDMQAVTMDIYMDVLQFRDHVMTHREAAERLKNDIVLASKLGFKNVRSLCLVPIDVIEMALPTAEKYGVKIGKEIHAPLPIFKKDRPQPKVGMAAALDFRMAEQIMELKDRTGSDYVGLVPDFGIFQFRPTQISIDYTKRHVKSHDAIDWILENSKDYGMDEIHQVVRDKFPGNDLSPMHIESLSLHQMSADPEDLREIVPYIVSIHGKFYQMTEIPGHPGQYEDKSINYEDPIRILKEEGYDGYIDSEYEGQRSQQDRGEAYLPDSVEEVRRHHEMLKRLIGE